jgi:branched-chain amino acid transport system permease protein
VTQLSDRLIGGGRALHAARRVRPLYWGVVVIVLATVVVATTQSSYLVFIFNSIMLACMGAIALQVLQGTAGLASVGTAGFLLIGSFGSVFLLRAGIGFPFDVVFAGLLAGIAGLITGLPALRLKSLFLALATLAAYFVSFFLGTLYQQHVPIAQSTGFSLPTLFSSAGLDNGGRYWAWFLLPIVLLVVIGASQIMRDRSGRALRMLREHEHIAPTLGISVMRYKLLIFALSALVTGIEGGLLAHFSGSVSTDQFPLALSFQYVVMIVIGGLDSVAGAIIGAAIVIALPVWVSDIVGFTAGQSRASVLGPNVALIVYGALVIIFVTSSPNGIMGLLRTARGLVVRRAARGSRTSVTPAPEKGIAQ